MKKKILVCLAVCMLLTGCNMNVIDTAYTFKHAYIEGYGLFEIRSWCDYENSDMIQITTTDGTTYLTHSSNVVLISK